MNRYYYEDRSYREAGSISPIMNRIFTWMSGALLVTGLTAYTVSTTPSLFVPLYSNPWILFGLFLIQMVLVVSLSSMITQLSLSAAFIMFFAYSVLTGATLSGLFFVYTTGSIASTFLVSAGMFGGMALYGYTTQADLTSMGSLLRMALWGLILALLVNMFLKNEMLDLITAIIGVVVFAGLTAFDIQRIKQLSYYLMGQGEVADKIAIVCALQLYLDFINLFISLLRIMGVRRQND
jgi:uncharacterized protein